MPIQFENLTKIVLKCLNVSATGLVFGHHLKNKSFNKLTFINISNTRFVRHSDYDCRQVFPQLLECAATAHSTA